jgi:spore coat polysaccharide biosynthesis predicted glycosyltransferase SpsG
VVARSRKDGADIVIVDSYRFEADYFRRLKEAGLFVVTLDDLAAFELPVDMVINGSAGAERLPYRALKNTRFVLGPRFILLAPEFADPPPSIIRDQIEHVLITVGGSDPHNLTPRLIKWTGKALGPVQVDVVVGPLFQNVEEIMAAADEQPGSVTLHHDPLDLRSLMLGADVAISGGGQTTYQLAATGTPIIAIRLAENQTINLNGLSEVGALMWVGDIGDARLEARIVSALKTLAKEPTHRKSMSEQGRSLVDGSGAARAARAILDSASVC